MRSSGPGLSGLAAPAVTADDRELLEQLHSHVERRHRELQSEFDEFARRRAAMSTRQRSRARETLLAQATGISNELARLNVARAVIGMLLVPFRHRRPAVPATVPTSASARRSVGSSA
jgi:hypothetical protein